MGYAYQLVQTKVRLAGKYCRLGVKIRSNPSNKEILRNVAILVAIPPDIDGETMKMSREGGLWDSMKRIIVWGEPELISGETIDEQLQFELGHDKDIAKNPIFPLLVRCDAQQDQLSNLEFAVHGIKSSEKS